MIILPLRWLIINFPTAWVQKKAPFRFTSITVSQSFSVISKAGLRILQPALFTRMSTFLNLDCAACTSSETSLTFVMSAFWISTCRSVRSTAWLTLLRSTSVLSVRTMSLPCSAKPRAIALPRPPAAPVTMETLLVKSKIFDLFIGRPSLFAGILT